MTLDTQPLPKLGIKSRGARKALREIGTIVPSKLRNDRFFRRFVSDSFVNYEGHICVLRDHNSLQAACEKLQVSV
jgi:hypothetical protein